MQKSVRTNSQGQGEAAVAVFCISFELQTHNGFQGQPLNHSLAEALQIHWPALSLSLFLHMSVTLRKRMPNCVRTHNWRSSMICACLGHELTSNKGMCTGRRAVICSEGLHEQWWLSCHFVVSTHSELLVQHFSRQAHCLNQLQTRPHD
jgi:hypothetical protein